MAVKYPVFGGILPFWGALNHVFPFTLFPPFFIFHVCKIRPQETIETQMGVLQRPQEAIETVVEVLEWLRILASQSRFLTPAAPGRHGSLLCVVHAVAMGFPFDLRVSLG